jgi:hypothetical protein
MLSVEERCLESLAWQPGSSLYAALAAAVHGGEDADADAGAQSPLEPGKVASSAEQQQAHAHAGVALPAAALHGGDGLNERRPGGALTPSKRSREGAEAPATSATDAEMAEAPEALSDAEPAAAAPAGTVPQLAGGHVPLSLGSKGLPGGRGGRSARTAVEDFLRRVLKLGAIRLADLLSRMGVAPADPHQLLAEVQRCCATGCAPCLLNLPPSLLLR